MEHSNSKVYRALKWNSLEPISVNQGKEKIRIFWGMCSNINYVQSGLQHSTMLIFSSEVLGAQNNHLPLYC